MGNGVGTSHVGSDSFRNEKATGEVDGKDSPKPSNPSLPSAWDKGLRGFDPCFGNADLFSSRQPAPDCSVVGCCFPGGSAEFG